MTHPALDEHFFRHEYGKLVAMLSVFIAMPIVLYQLWAFIAPGLYSKEKAVATNKAIEYTRVILEGLGPHHFPVVVGGDEVSRPKPAPDGLELTCLRLGTGVTDAVYVGERSSGVQVRKGALEDVHRSR